MRAARRSLASLALLWPAMLVPAVGEGLERGACAAGLCGPQQSCANVLVVYASRTGHTEQLAEAVAQGARSAGAATRVRRVADADYPRDVKEWADAVVLGSGTFNGNIAPELLQWVDSWLLRDDLGDTKRAFIGASFATAGGAAAGLQPVLEGLNRLLFTFRAVLVGGASWESGQGTGVVVPDGEGPLPQHGLALGRGHGARVARLTSRVLAGAGGCEEGGRKLRHV